LIEFRAHFARAAVRPEYSQKFKAVQELSTERKIPIFLFLYRFEFVANGF
jgi:hypothetical protein